jgi:hypothetical protein
VIEKSRKPFFETFCICEKSALVSENEYCVVVRVGTVHCAQECLRALCKFCLMQPAEEFLQ